MIAVVGLNDLHGRLAALPTFAGYAQNLQAELGEDGGVLIVDAGDSMQGTLESNLTEGASIVAAYQQLGVRAAAIGNHEFDFGPLGVDTRISDPGADPHGALEARLSEASFPFLSANLIDDKTGKAPTWRGLFPSTLIDAAGIRIGLVGVLTAETPKIVMPAYFRGLDVTPLDAALVREARELKARGASAVIALAHAGGACKRFDQPNDTSSCEDGEIFRVARALPRGLVDAIVAGHTHAGVAHYVNGIPIVEAYANGRAFSRIDLVFDARSRRVLRAIPHPPEPLCFEESVRKPPCPAASYAGASVTPDLRVAAAIAPALELARSRREQPLGVIVTAPVRASFRVESALGNLFSDLLLSAVPRADVAIVNGGGLRADLPPGELTYGKLYEAMPFDNRLAFVKLTAAELSEVIAVHVSHARHGLISISGVRALSRCEGQRLVVWLERPDGTRVDAGEALGVVTSDYLASGGDDLFAPAKLSADRVNPDLGSYVRDALGAELRRRGGTVSGRDRPLLDPAKPRISLPSARPVVCH